MVYQVQVKGAALGQYLAKDEAERMAQWEIRNGGWGLTPVEVIEIEDGSSETERFGG